MNATVQAAERRRVLAFLREGSEPQQQFHHDKLPAHAKQKLWRLKRGMRTLRAAIKQ